MKFKEILKNKWAWIGGIIGLFSSFYLMTIFAIGGMQQSLGNPSQTFTNLQQFWFFGPVIFMQESGISDIVLLKYITLWNVFLYTILGSISGLILQKVYRRLK